MTIARKLRAGAALALLGGLVVGGSVLLPATPASADEDPKYCVLHKGKYVEVDEDSLSAHQQHGDTEFFIVPPDGCPVP